MKTDTFDTIARAAGADRRRAMLALGAAGLAMTLAQPRAAWAGKAGKKARKKCKRQIATCTDQVTAYCAQTAEPTVCQDVLLPCCASCHVADGVMCVLNALEVTA